MYVRRPLPSTGPWPVARTLNVGIGPQPGSVEVVGVVVVVVAIVESVTTEDTGVSIQDWVEVEDADVSTEEVAVVDEVAEPTVVD